MERWPAKQRVTGSVLVRAHAWLAGLMPVLGVKEKQPIDVSLPLCLPPFPSLKINVKEKKLLQLRYYLLICSDLIG